MTIVAEGTAITLITMEIWSAAVVRKPCWGNMSLRWARQEPWPVFGKGTANTEQPFIELAERVGRVPLLVPPHKDAS